MIIIYLAFDISTYTYYLAGPTPCESKSTKKCPAM